MSDCCIIILSTFIFECIQEQLVSTHENIPLLVNYPQLILAETVSIRMLITFVANPVIKGYTILDMPE